MATDSRARPRRRGVRLGIAALAGLLLLGALGLLAGASVGGEEGEDSTGQEELRLRVGSEPSGQRVSLDVSVLAPSGATPGADGQGRRAAVVLAHGFGGSKADLAQQARGLAADGYVVLTYTARGFGESGGRIHLDSPDYEIDDVSALLDLLADREDVLLDAEGDPVVGVAGASYGGAAALMAAGHDDRVDAVVAAITWHDLGQSLFPQHAAQGPGESTPAELEPVAEPGVFKRRWASLFFAGGTGPPREGDPATACGRFAPRVCELYAGAAATGRPSQEMLELLRRSSPAPVLDRIDAPTLLIQGQQDSLFPLTEADANARGIAAAGTPVSVHWIDGGHDARGAARTGPSEPLADWFDHHLRGGPDPGPGFVFSPPVPALAEDASPEQLAAPDYPVDGLDDSATTRLAGEPQQVVSPPGGEPSAITSLPGSGGLGSLLDLSGTGYGLAVLPGQAATFETAPFEQAHRVVGSPRVRLSVSSTAQDATVFASLWVVSGDGTPMLPRQLVAPVRLDGLTPGEPREVEVVLPASVYEVEQGQSLRLVVSTTDAAYAVPAEPRAYRISLTDAGALGLPGVDAERIAGGPVVPVPLVAAVAALVLLAAGGAVWTSRRRPGEIVPAVQDVPLVVEGLVKTYADGLRAVDEVSWRAERGQVVGLLGPNGAGKTTTMRMLVGLIRPDGGRTLVLGREVTPGAAVLGRVGALIEGPGFLPHLTGRANLAAYWAATGRPAAEARVDDALEIAGLGAAVDRVVRSYSHGMKQRLGIAQAMLGLPELLLLDEPTNGLDPPQIKALRGVLQRYAAAGRTVVVSSHLLAEVEQTCSHVVVMHRGRVVLTGAVDALVDRDGPTLITVDGADPARAVAVLRGLAGVTGVTVDEAGRLRVLGAAARPQLVAALVGAGVPVSAVDGRRHLEEVFMALVGEHEVVG